MCSKYSLLSVLLIFVITACSTPQTAETPTELTEPETAGPSTTTPQDEQLSSCTKFTDIPNGDQMETNYVLYRDFLRAREYERAYDLWQKVYEAAPAADGRRNTVFADGIRFYERFISQTQDQNLIEGYVDTIFQIYDRIQECYPEGGYIAGRKAFDLYYKYPNREDSMTVFNLFKEAVDTDGEKVPDFVINPMAALLVDLYRTDRIDQATAEKYGKFLLQVVEEGVAECKGSACERWEIIQAYTPQRLEYFETIRGFYDCDYYVEKYYPEFVDKPDDCDVIRTVYSRLKWGGCGEGNEQLAEVTAAGNQNCRTTGTGKVSQAYEALREGQYRQSIDLFLQAAEDTEDADRKGTFLLTVAKIYYSHLKNFSRARQYALQAAQFRTNWGEPYLLIGRLYASSGPLCGPGRGWDSQVVVWPAIDMWQRAKRVDSSVSAEANEYINRYRQYMPSREDVFQRNLKEGDSFTVGCWIQETTTIRTP